MPASPLVRWCDPAATVGAALSSDGSRLHAILRDGIHYDCSCEGNAVWGRICWHIKALDALLVEPALAEATTTAPAHTLVAGSTTLLATRGIDPLAEAYGEAAR